MAETPPADLSPFRAVVNFSSVVKWYIRYSYFEPEDGSSTVGGHIVYDPADTAWYDPADQAYVDEWPNNRVAELEANGFNVLAVFDYYVTDKGPYSYSHDGQDWVGRKWDLGLSYRYTHDNWLSNPDTFDSSRQKRYFEFVSDIGDGTDWKTKLPAGEQEKFGFRLDEGPATVGA